MKISPTLSDTKTKKPRTEEPKKEDKEPNSRKRTKKPNNKASDDCGAFAI